jgi:hypothetical protein
VISFNTADPVNSASLATITGVATGQTLVSIDRRPQNGSLYGLGYNATTGDVQLYKLSLPSNLAAPLGTVSPFFVDGAGDPVRVGVDALTSIGMDFNPTVDRVRVVTDNGQNFRLNPNTGAFVDGNLGGETGSVAGVNMDGNINGGTTTVGETAYTNNAPDSTFTTQYTLDASTDSLYRQTPPNAGTQAGGVALTKDSAALDLVEIRGFDILRGVNTASSGAAVFSGSGLAIIELASNSQQRIAQVDLVTGAVSGDTLIGDGTSNLLGLAAQSATGPDMIALLETGNIARFNAASPGTITTAVVTGLTSGETLVGIDFRPTTGQLFGLGVDPSADTGTLYQIDPQGGAATAVGTPSSIVNGDLPEPSVGYGFNFNPTVDRIRVVTGSGLNFRLNPDTGAVAAVDSAINGAATGVTATSYSNAFGGATVTTQYALDASTSKLLIQNPPNSGVTTEVVTLSIPFGAVGGFEVPSTVRTTASGTPVTSGSGYAALTLVGITGLYQINLVTGEAPLLGSIGDGTVAVRGLAVGELTAD